MPGTLFVVATPIGNLEDITLRALRTLREVAIVAAEDTRRTAGLLAHYEISTPLLSVREHNEARQLPELLTRLAAGQSVALVTDAGTPGIADPGSRVVAGVRAAGYPVVAVPGPSAVTAALSVSGFAFDEFVFMGFPPASGAARERWFDRLSAERRVAVLYEAPHRIARTLGDVKDACGNRPILLLRELTKIHEQLVTQPITGAPQFTSERGEFTVVIGPAPEHSGVGLVNTSNTAIYDMFCQLTERDGLDDTTVVDFLAWRFAKSPQSIRKCIKKIRYSGNTPNAKDT